MGLSRPLTPCAPGLSSRLRSPDGASPGHRTLNLVWFLPFWDGASRSSTAFLSPHLKLLFIPRRELMIMARVQSAHLFSYILFPFFLGPVCSSFHSFCLFILFILSFMYPCHCFNKYLLNNVYVSGSKNVDS